MGATLSIILLIVVVAVLLIVRRAQSGTKKDATPVKATATSAAGTKYHAVSIRSASSGCEAAKALKDKRMLSNEAPTLPLPDCDAAECKCRYVHFDDRRASDDRRDTYTGSIGGGTGEHQQEQRTARDRRKPPPDDFSGM